MRKVLAVLMLALLAFVPTLALAGEDGGGKDGNNTITNNNTATGGAGGRGGSGGTGIGYGGSAYSDNNSNSYNDNSNSNRNTNRNYNSQGQEQGQSQSQRQSNKQGQAQNNKQNIAPAQNTTVTNETDVPRQAPPAFAPNLVAAPETCMGSTAIGASTPFGGVSVGSTYKSEDCELRMFARSLQALGQSEAALALLAQNEKVAAALKASGFKAAWLRQEKGQSVAIVTPSFSSAVQNFAADRP